MKDLRKIIALFFIIFAIGVGVIVGSISKKLNEPTSTDKIEILTDTTYLNYDLKKNV